MRFERLLITGGAGFVGSNLAVMLATDRTGTRVVAVDNLKRRGSELNLARLRDAGVKFIHADIRCPEDLKSLPEFDLMVDCSAEPSVQAGMSGSPRYVLQTNLAGTINCLELSRTRNAAFLFLSTSRVYPIDQINNLKWRETESRYVWQGDDAVAGFSSRGIAEEFPLAGARSFYGTSKLAAEQILQEYVHAYGMQALVNRCGVIAGPWQMGKVDQGVVSLWVASHVFGKPLNYVGYGGHGKQVRDLLHVRDLFELIVAQMESPDIWDGRVYAVGGGEPVSVSLRELTSLCQDVTGNRIAIGSVPETSTVDVRIFLTDSRRACSEFGWKPVRGAARIVADVHDWIVACRSQLEAVFS